MNVAHEITEGTTLRAVRNVDRRAAPRLGATVKFYPHRQRLRRASRRAPRVEVRAACRLSGVLPRAQRGAYRVERVFDYLLDIFSFYTILFEDTQKMLSKFKAHFFITGCFNNSPQKM